MEENNAERKEEESSLRTPEAVVVDKLSIGESGSSSTDFVPTKAEENSPEPEQCSSSDTPVESTSEHKPNGALDRATPESVDEPSVPAVEDVKLANAASVAEEVRPNQANGDLSTEKTEGADGSKPEENASSSGGASTDKTESVGNSVEETHAKSDTPKAAETQSAVETKSEDDPLAKLDVHFKVIRNDGDREHLIQLMDLKNIFSKQLPKMPKEYIVRLVFDRRHKSLILLKRSTNAVIGGICYRVFETQHFAEIAFCAITATEQVKGFGTLLMNQLKETVKKEGVTHFLTFADNYAIGYFKKQGFSKQMSMSRERWVGYIKEYDGGTLMECSINMHVDYTQLKSVLKRQREELMNRIKKFQKSNRVYPGIQGLAESRIADPYNDIPGLKESGWTAPSTKSGRTREGASLTNHLLSLLRQIKSHRSAWPFLQPVDPKEVPDYLDIIKDPIDLSLIEKRLNAGDYYKSKSMFRADLQRMCTNCTTYNAPDTNYYKFGLDMKNYVEQIVVDED